MRAESNRKTRYSGVQGLTELPWFEKGEDGRVRLVDDGVGPIADVHTHLALSYLRRGTVDLRAEHPETEHYLPASGELDLDVYANRNFTPRDLSRMKRDLGLGSLLRSGMRRTHTAPNLSREMSDLGVRVSVLLPIELPVLSWNAEAYLEVVRDRPELVSLGSVHPFGHKPLDRLAHQHSLGARGVKLHPAVQLVPADHEKAMAIYRTCADLSLPVLWHCGPVGIEPAAGRWCSQLKHYWGAVRDNPDTTFVLGHSGALQMELAVELANRYPNVWLELASQGLSNVRTILDQVPTDRIMFGTDWPFYHQAFGLVKVLIATEGKPELRHRVLWENAARLFGLEVGA